MAHPEPAEPSAPAIVWFRDDLRIADNLALAAAAGSGRPVIALFVLDEESPGLRPRGGASRWWLAGSLRALDRSLRERGLALTLRRGPAARVIAELTGESGAAAVYWNRRYEPAGAAVDQAVAADISARGVAVQTFQASLLFEPQAVQTRSGAPFAVFTPFLRHVLALDEPRTPLPAPARIRSAAGVASERLDDWALEPSGPDWAAKFNEHWTRGEAAACEKLAAFADGALADYAALRDRPGGPHTSRLSPHLRFGEISPFQLWHAVRHAREAAAPRSIAASADKFVSELVWREFCHHLLWHHPDLAVRNFQPRFDDFPWRSDDAALKAWRRGETGYPIVDAGMRELWATGWMHNRVRLVAASFLIKHLLIDWRDGERWFWDTLLDADPANNPANWQWVAGSGADAAPYFRIFNPVLQGAKFDAAGEYVRRWIPELSGLPADAIHAPFEAPPAILAAAGVTLGETYPAPIVDHKVARKRALAAFERIRERTR
ncbi:MAG TPA: deoxyribodipyrimidine photo-lyase [Rhodoplanes sp.]|nr:deoxyribodipyrimidine photo-lyase [Rhodoplanes sp.]